MSKAGLIKMGAVIQKVNPRATKFLKKIFEEDNAQAKSRTVAKSTSITNQIEENNSSDSTKTIPMEKTEETAKTAPANSPFSCFFSSLSETIFGKSK